jgi:two-component system, LytTR family, sensor kinase
MTRVAADSVVLGISGNSIASSPLTLACCSFTMSLIPLTKRLREKRFADIYGISTGMKQTIDVRKLRLYLWLGLGYFFLGFMTTIGKYPTRFFAVFFNNVWGVLYLIVVNFVLFEYSLPFVLKKRSTIIQNILLAFVLLFGHMMLYSYGAYAWRQIGVAFHIYTPLREFSSLDALLENQMGYSVGSLVLFALGRHIYNYVTLSQAEQQLRIEKQAAELNYLRSQTNPHFLFNTLNNIYSLARDKSDRAAESILRLSKILRFMLYETAGNFIAIEQELQIIRDYVDLEKLRYDESLRVNFNNDIEDMKQAIPPLLLIPLVENAFKHGVSETRNQPFVDIHLSVNKRILTFIVKNSTDGSDEQQQVKENIGLSNLRRQLELLYTDYSLTVKPQASVFTATLKINLASHV